MADTTPSLVHRFLNDERGISDETLAAFGCVDDEGAIYFPYGSVTKGRRHDPDGKRHFFYPKGSVTSLFASPRAGSNIAFLVEGESDTLRLYQELGGTCDVFGIPGITTWKDEWAGDLKKYEEVYVILDNDSDYKVAAVVDRTWIAIRRAIGSSCKRVYLPDNVNDLCEFFDAYNVDALRELAARPSNKSWHYEALDLSKPASKPNWLVDDLIAQGDLCMMIGEPGKGKSWIAMALAVAIAEGQGTFLGRSISTSNSRVLYVDEENPEALIPYRLNKLGLRAGQSNVRYLHQQGVRVDKHPEFILEEALDFDPAIIILDSLTRIHTVDENHAGEISALFNDGIVPLARTTGSTVLLLHHVNKTDSSSSFTRARGSSDLSGVIDTGLDLRDSGGALVLHHYKSRWVAEGGSIHLKIEDTPGGGVALTTRRESAVF